MGFSINFNKPSRARLYSVAMAIFCAVGLFSSASWAQTSVIKTETIANATVAGSQERTSVAMDGSNNFAIAWEDSELDGDGFGVYVQQFDNTGTVSIAEFLVNSTTANDQRYPDIAMDNSGNYVVVWMSDTQDGDGWGIYARVYNSSGVAQTSEFVVNTTTAGEQRFPSVAMDSSGDFVIVWESDQNIYARLYNSAGTAQGVPFLVNTENTTDKMYPNVAMDDSGDFVVVWQSLDQDTDGYGIYMQRYNSSGTAQGSETLVNTETGEHQIEPSVAMDADGDYIITWSSYAQDTDDYGVYGQLFTSAGATTGSEFKVNTTNTGVQHHSDVAMSSNGIFTVSWTSFGQDGSFGGVYMQVYNTAGTAKGSETIVNTTTDDSQHFSSGVINGDEGHMLIAWQDGLRNTTATTDTDEYGIYFKEYSISDITDPVAVCQDITVSLDGTGNLTLTAAQVDNGSSDANGVALSIDVSAFTCSNLGTNTVTLTATDPAGNQSTCQSTVTIQDTTDPTVVTQDITVQLDGTGNVTITAAQVDNGSSDNCETNLGIDVTAFDCTDIGANTVTLTVTDGVGNSANTTATVTVEDSVDPTVVAQDITVQLDATGNVTITPAQIDNGSADNCTANLSLDITAFDCTDLGANTVTLTVTDDDSNSVNTTATVTVEDSIDPTVVAQDITVQLDGTGNVSITPAQIDNGSADNCTANLSLDVMDFDCTDLGANTVTLTVSDDDGNSVNTTATVTVEDSIDPTVVAQDITVQLDGTGNITITPAQVDNGSADNCTANLSLDVMAFDCTDIGANTVTLTVSDNDGNSVNTTATVTVQDVADPTVVAQDITVQLDATGNVTITAAQIDNGSSDNCEANLSIDITAFDCTDIGANTVTLTVTDGQSNSVNTTATVTVEDSIDPTVVAQDITVQLDGTGNVSITPAQIDNGSADNCTANLSLDVTAFDCTDLGANTVTLTVSDTDGNSVNTTATVTVEDSIDPTVVAQDITVQLDGTGNITITPAQIDNGSADNCTANLSLDVMAFDCTDVGANTVTLTVSDDDGNSVNTTATVTVQDTADPTVVAQDITVQLDGTGNVSITAAQIDNGSADNCTANLSIDVTAFDCTDIGANTVTLTVTDGVGNSVNTTATVTVEDSIDPTVVAQDITVQLDGTGNVSITPAQIDNGSADNCTANLSLDVTAFDCTDLGANTVTLTVSDTDGNSVNTTATVTVEDSIDPTVVAQDITVQLDGTGNITITPAQIDNGSADNCTANLSLDVMAFDCTDVGANTVTLTVSDDDGNSVNTTATVTVQDTADPTVVAQDITVQLDATGNVSITAAQVDNGSSDNCTANLSIDVSAFDCTDIGANTVTLTVTDGVGNSVNTTATVTVEDSIDPTVVAQDITVQLDGTGNVSITPAQIDNGSADNCTANLSLDVMAFDCTDLGANTVTLTVSDDDGNSVNTTATVTVEDSIDPTVVAQNITVQLDGTGNITITPAQVDNGSADNCTANLSLDVMAFDCTDVGANTVTLTVSDDDGNSVNTTATVTVQDTADPTAVAQDITVQLDGTGNASITAAQIDNGSSDNCTANLSIDVSVFDCTDIGVNTVTLTVTDGVGNSVNTTATVTVEDSIDPTVVAQDITVQLDGTGNVSITPAQIDNGSADNCTANLSLDVMAFDCTDLGANTVTLTVSDDDGNSVNTTATVTVEDSIDPTVVAQNITVQLDGTGNITITPAQVDNGSADNCTANLSLDVMAFDCTDVGANTVTLTVSDDDGNSVNTTATVTVQDTADPTAVAQDITVQLDGTGNASITAAQIDNGSSDNCTANLSIDVSAFDCTDIGANTVTLTVTDGVGNSVNTTATVTVEDSIDPTVVAQDITVQLDGTGNVSITPAQIDNGSADNCTANLSLDVMAFDCTDLGANTVTLTVSDDDGNSVNTTATVTVEDSIDPTVVAQNITVQLDGTGNITITPAQVDNGSADNCTANLSLDVMAFDCTDVGANTVTLTVSDDDGNSVNTTATVTVQDAADPTAVAQDITVQLDGTGNASITAAQIDNGSADNCTANLSLDVTAFDCTDIGINVVTLTVTDGVGNSVDEIAMVTVEDNEDPTVSTQNITVQLDGTGNVSITPAQIDNGSADNCTANLSLDVMDFDCTDIGANTVTLTVVDDDGNSVNATATVTVEDNANPTVVAQDITVQLDGTGNVSITAAQVDNGSSDNCTANLSIDVTAFDCTDIGANTVTLTVSDDDGNSVNTTATVTVEDAADPTVVAQDITVQLDGTGNASITAAQIDNGSSDNCTANLSIDVSAFDCTDIGANTVTLTVSDTDGNSVNTTATVTVEDSIDPTVVAQDITVQLDGTGNVSITPAQVDNGSADNCTANLSLDVMDFDCTDIGANTVTLTVSDDDGNSVNATATVTVEDNADPTVVAQDITVQLDGTGNVSITAAQVDNGSSDNCTANLSIDVTAFDCTDIGANTVTLTVSDTEGNSVNTTATVTVEDAADPTVVAQDITVQLDGTGNATITAAQIDNGSSDNCTANLSIDVSAFDCTDIGANTVTLTVSDTDGNSVNTTATVTVEDSIDPTVVAQDITVQLDGSGNVSITPAQVDNGSADNCTVNLSLDVMDFDCTDIGANTVTLTVSDDDGNSVNATATVTVEDNADPTVVAQDITVQLDGTGNVSITAAQVDNGSSDNCTANLSIDVTAFDCTDIGANTVTLTVSDDDGNSVNTTATVTVEDAADPTVVAQDITVQLDATGNASITAAQIDNGSSDNCTANLSIDVSSFDCTDIGANTVTLTVSDTDGNSVNTTATVTVEDSLDPTVVAQDITVQLDGTGNVSITPAQIDNGSADNCTANLSLDVMDFDCTDIGANTVTLTVSDDDGNSVNATATVTVEDNADPTVVAQDITVQLDGTGNVSITAAQVDNGSSDNCTANLSIDVTAFDCTDIGANTVTLTVSDTDGNSVNTTATVTVEDAADPTAVAQDITVQLDGTGNASITAAQIDNGSSDNCTANLSLDVTAFDCTDIGINVVTLTVTDGVGNSVDEIAMVTVEDNEDPTASTQNITVQLDGTGNVSITPAQVDNGSADNCTANLSLDVMDFDCTDIGANTVTLTVSDDDGNSVNATATVTVEDNTNPAVVAQDITVQLDGTGNVSITAAQVDNGSSDNCTANLSIDVTAFDCTDIGANTVTLTVSDTDGNSVNTTATVTVEDAADPTVVAQDITVQLDGTGNASITAAQIDNGSSDNCTANLSLDVTAFDCTDIGINVVTLTVTDGVGNSVDEIAMVTVEDNEDPTVSTQNITVQLDGTGNVSITPAQIDNGSADNCTANLSLDVMDFDCTDIGANTVTLTVSDDDGNSVNATATVTVEDNAAPTVVAQDITVQLDGTGNVSITAAQVDNGSSDNCTANLSIDVTAFDCTDIGANTVTLTVSDTEGNSVNTTATVTVEDAVDPTAVAQDITVQLDGTGNASITAAQIDNGSSDNCTANLSIDVSAFDCTDIGANTVTLTVSDPDGNSVNTTATVTVEDNEDPTATTQNITVQLDGTGNVSITPAQIDNGSADNCTANLSLDVMDFDCTDIGANTVTLTVSDDDGNSVNATATVTVEDNADPTVVAQDITVQLDGTGNVSITAAQVDNGSSDNCTANLSIDVTAFDCTDIGANTVTLTVSDTEGNSVNTTATVTVEDAVDPTAVAQDITVQLDGTGNASITAAQIDNGSSDNCTANLSIDVSAFDCTDIGANTVTLTVSDPDGNSVNTTATVTVEDNEDPTVSTQNITVQLDGTGNVSITPAQIDNGSADNCTANLSLDVMDFDCTDIGANTVTLTVSDDDGNSVNATATVTVEDNAAPTVVAQDITVQLDGTGNVSITAAQVDNGSSDNCSTNLSLDFTAFDCTDLGANSVTLTVTDGEGNSVNTTATVTVEDNELPTVVTQDITIQLDGAGNANISAAQIDNGSSDNCSTSLSLDITAFDCSDVGINVVTLTVTDGSGNSADDIAMVTVEDNENPVVVSQDITVQLDGTGNVTITPSQVDNGSSDNCSADLSLDITTFDCTDIGANTVTLTVTDNDGNSVNTTATVTVQDNEAPIAVAQNITVQLDETGNVSITPAMIGNGSTDNCTTNLSLDITTFDCANLGVNTVTLTVTDGEGNSANNTATVTVEDDELPTVVTQDITVQLDGTGNAIITTAQVDNGSADNCSTSLSLDITTFDCSDVGLNTVTLTVSDAAGNSAQETATVTVEDNEAPVVVAQDITVQLDATGNVTITAAQIDNGSSDNCTTNLSLDVTDFDCTNIGANTVTLTASDNDGNSVNTTATVTVEDNEAPALIAQDITVQLDGTGNVTITPEMVDNGSTDNCSTNLSLDITTFDCSNLGDNTVTLTVTDGAGNSSNIATTVTVEDDELPTAFTQDITVQLDGTGNAMITSAQIDNGSTDNCSTSFSLDITNFDCTNVGVNIVTLTVSDAAGNSAQETATVTIEDNEAPVVMAQDITVQLDGTGNATITAAQVDNGSTDNCSANLSLDMTDFDCSNIGANIVTLTVTDNDGNSANTTATVTVEDTEAPTAVAQDITVQLDGTGSAIITAAQVDNGSTDNCTVSLSLDVSAFDCTNLGANSVTLTATDGVGNAVNTTATVTVEDSEAPVAVTQDITVELDGTGQVMITPSQVDNGSSDNCQANLSLDVTSFDCTNIGINVVTLTVTDGAGNSADAIAMVTVEDNASPIAIAQDITVQLDATGNASITTALIDDGSSDNCSATLTLDITSFDCTDLGANTVTLTVTDNDGNSANTTAVVTVEDKENPIAVAQDITVQLDAAGNATITAEQVDNGSSDNCEVNLSLDVATFDCTDIGSNTVTLTVTDGAGNTVNTTATINVEDVETPTAIAQDITVQLDATGNVSITAAQVDNGSSDNCSTTLSIDITEFDCTNLGSNTVILTATDPSGNTSQETAIVTVQDDIAPMLMVQDVTVELDGSGSYILQIADVNNGTSDNCSFSLSLDKTEFSCSDIGANTITVNAIDGQGNEISDEVIVTVEDNQVPTAIAMDIGIQLDENGEATISAADLDGGSSDNCNITLSASQTTFAASDIGDVNVTLTVRDDAGNEATDIAVVTIEANVPPAITSTGETAVNEDELYTYNIVAEDDNFGDALTLSIATIPGWLTLTDNGDGTGLLTGTPENDDVGDHTIDLVVTDRVGDTDTESFIITVTNVNDAPMFMTTPVTSVNEGVAYQYDLSVVDVDAGDAITLIPVTIPDWLTYTDNGGGTASLSGDPTNDEVGTYDVEIRAEDQNGGTETQSFTVTVININDDPVIEGATFTIDENSPSGTLLGTIQATDIDADEVLTFSIIGGNVDDAFAIDANTGALTVSNSAAVDFETTPIFTLTVQVEDLALANDFATVEVNLNDVDDDVNTAPEISDQTFDIDENSPFDTVLGALGATDADGDELSYTIVGGNIDLAFAVNTAGELVVNNTEALDFETRVQFILRIEVNDGKGGIASATITVDVNDIDDTANSDPTIGDQEFTIDENSANGSLVGQVLASDPDNDQLIYSITVGNIDDAFAISREVGLITVNNVDAVDFETNPVFNLVIEISDGQGGVGRGNVTVNLNDLNDPPVTGLSDELEESILMFPNPSQSHVSISSEHFGSGDVKLKLYNLSGVEMPIEFLRSGTDAYETNIGELAPGIYMITIEVNNKTALKKLMKF